MLNSPASLPRRHRSHFRSRFLWCAIGITAALALAACDKPNKTVTATDRTLVLARSSEPEWLNPIAGHQHPDADLALFRGLFRQVEGSRLVPDMAQDYAVSPDGLTYTVKLRPGIRWHDGVDFSAQDVKFTIDTILAPANHSGLRAQLTDIAQVEVLDPLTVKIVLSKPLSSLPAKLQVGIVPKHVLEGKDFNSDRFSQEAPIGTGPFKFESRRRNEYLVYVANPDFYLGAPKVDRLIYKIIPDSNVRLIQLVKGEIDVAGLNPKEVSSLKGSDIEIKVLDSADARVMMFNFKYVPFQDVRVRRAIQYATDRQALVDGALLGYGVPAYAPLQMLPESALDLPKHDNDLERAKALLAEAGWKPGSDGIAMKDGQALSFELVVPTNDPTRLDLAQMLSAQLRRAGIDARVVVKDWSAFKIQDATALILGGGAPDDADDNVYRFFSSKLGAEGTNYNAYSNPKVDVLLDAARNELDADKRKRLYQDLQRELVNDPPYNQLVYLKHIYGVRKGWNGFRPRLVGHGTTPLWNIEEWARAGATGAPRSLATKAAGKNAGNGNGNGAGEHAHDDGAAGHDHK